MPTERTKPETIGFGFMPMPQAAHHFVVTIPRADAGSVLVAERFAYGEEWEDAAARARLSDGEPMTHPIRAPQPKVEVSKHKWQIVADRVKTEFNRQLRTGGLKAGAWKPGENLLSPHLGKELTLLLWAIEDADPSRIPNAIENWVGLAPEERWWLYTTINAATGHVSEGRGRGWRRAIRIAFEDNPVKSQSYFSQNTLPARHGLNGRNGSGGKGRKAVQDDEAIPQLSLLTFEESTKTDA